MKILILNWRDMHHPLSGGAEVSLFEHAKYWSKMNNEVIWFSSSFPGAKVQEVIENIQVIRRGSHYTAHIWAFIYFTFKKFGKVDLIVDNFHFIPFFTPLYLHKIKIIALINEIAGTIWFANLPKFFAFIGFICEPFFFHFYRNIPFITSSRSTKDELVRLGIPSRKIEIIYHGISRVKVSAVIKKEQVPTLAFLGRISMDKGITDVITAFLDAKKTVKNLTLWIIGKEEKRGMMRELLQDIPREIKKDINYFGFVTEEKKFQLLKRAWLLLHASQKEGWGLNVIEAATQGTPTIGYNVEGLRDSIQNGKTGILVESQNPSLLSAAILSIIVDKSKKMYKKLSSNAIIWSNNFNWSTSTKQSWNLVRKVYESKK